MPENRHFLEKALAADKRSPEHVHQGVSRPYAGKQGCRGAGAGRGGAVRRVV